MPIIKPISDLRNHANEISDLCKQENEPVFITKNGEGELVVMSHEYYEQLQARLELNDKLDAAQAQVRSGMKGIPHRTVMNRLRRRIREKSH